MKTNYCFTQRNAKVYAKVAKSLCALRLSLRTFRESKISEAKFLKVLSKAFGTMI
jgi:hypothetical protein